ncbi:O-antigen ligase family protein [Sphingomonas sp. DT-51]|uniref:O-antigen ligase family protein n=1 Tax=Sphingomonas sp. DT-51 TaxID=3396165 RepID=UPI003F1AF68F
MNTVEPTLGRAHLRPAPARRAAEAQPPRRPLHAFVRRWGALPLAIGVLLALGFGGDLTSSLAGVGGLAWRLGALLLVLVACRSGLNVDAAITFAIAFVPWLAASMIEMCVFLNVDQVSDYARQIFMVVIGAAVYAAAQSREKRAQVQIALLCAATLAAVLSTIMTIPLLQHGWSWEAVRASKNELVLTTGFGANTVCFAGMIAALASPQTGPERFLSRGLVAFFTVLSIILGARAPIGLFFLSALIALPLSKRSWNSGRARVSQALRLSAIVIGAIVLSFLFSIPFIAHSVIADGLAGRAGLWQIGLRGWWDAPLFGHGVHTWIDIVQQNLGAADYRTMYEMQSTAALRTGGFHNVWMNTLAERGLIGLAGLYASYSLLLTRLLANLPFNRREQRFQALVLFLFVFLRGFVEITGLMSYADAALDAIVIAALAVTIASDQPRRRRRARHRASAARPA